MTEYILPDTCLTHTNAHPVQGQVHSFAKMTEFLTESSSLSERKGQRLPIFFWCYYAILFIFRALQHYRLKWICITDHLYCSELQLLTPLDSISQMMLLLQLLWSVCITPFILLALTEAALVWPLIWSNCSTLTTALLKIKWTNFFFPKKVIYDGCVGCSVA